MLTVHHGVTQLRWRLVASNCDGCFPFLILVVLVLCVCLDRRMCLLCPCHSSQYLAYTEQPIASTRMLLSQGQIFIWLCVCVWWILCQKVLQFTEVKGKADSLLAGRSRIKACELISHATSSAHRCGVLLYGSGSWCRIYVGDDSGDTLMMCCGDWLACVGLQENLFWWHSLKYKRLLWCWVPEGQCSL
jgi:hypothetical protein